MSQLDPHIGPQIIIKLKLNFYSWIIIKGISWNWRHRKTPMQLHVDFEPIVFYVTNIIYIWLRAKILQTKILITIPKFWFSLLLYWYGSFLQIRHNMMRIIRKQTTYLQKHNTQVCPIYSGPFLWLVVVLNLLKALGHTWNLVRSP